MKKTILREYARLIVRSGVNVQKGQEVLIYADLDQPEFVQMVVEEAYKAKAKKVTVSGITSLCRSSMCATSPSKRWVRYLSGRKPDCSTMWT